MSTPNVPPPNQPSDGGGGRAGPPLMPPSRGGDAPDLVRPDGGIADAGAVAGVGGPNRVGGLKKAAVRKAPAAKKAGGVKKAAAATKAGPVEQADGGQEGAVPRFPGRSGGPGADPRFGPGWGPGRGRRRALYNRKVQRDNERWSPAARANAWLFRHPEPVLAALGRRAPVTVEGRVLNRSVQAMLAVVDRIQGRALPAPAPGVAPDPERMRSQLRRMASIAMPVRTDVHVTGRVVPAAESPDGSDGIPVRVYRRFGAGVGAGLGPRRRPPGIVYFHGGGWVTGDLVTHDASCRLLAAVSGCVVVAVDYRLAPEHPYPAAIDDAMAAYAWVHRNAGGLGIEPGRIGVMGDSAGGNIAAVLSLLTREGGAREVARRGSAGPAAADPLRAGPPAPPPVAQCLVYPVVKARLGSEAIEGPLADGFFLTVEGMDAFRAAYVPDESVWEDAAVSPLLVGDLGDLPPAVVVTAGFDPLRYDGDAYARRLADAGVEVEHRHYPDQVHGFFGMGILDDSLALSTEVCEVMGRLMHRGAGPGGADREV